MFSHLREGILTRCLLIDPIRKESTNRFPSPMPTLPSEEFAIDTSLQQAIAHHNSGNLKEAERLYHCILASDSNHPHAHHNLGILALQSRKANAALPYLRAALDLMPHLAHYWASYLNALMQAGLVADAHLALEEARKRGLQADRLEDLTVRLKTLSTAIDQKIWVPDLSGDSYIQVLDRLHRFLSPETYLEIGVETGATLALARCPSLGIDPEFRFLNIETVRRVVAKPTLLLYQMPSDDFFARFNPSMLLGKSLALAFLDGMHRCEFLLRDFLNTERHCRPDSVIVLHDCLPLEAPMAERTPNVPAIDPGRQRMWTGDVWRTSLLLKRRRPDLRMVVLDAAPTGLVLVTNLDPENTMLAEGEDQLVGEMMSWTLQEITLAGYYQEMGVEPEINLRSPEQIHARLTKA